MSKKRIWISLSVLLVVGLLGGIIGCQKAAPTTSPSPTAPAPSPTASPAPLPKPTASPTASPTPTPTASPKPTAPAPTQAQVIKWKGQHSIPAGFPPFSAGPGHNVKYTPTDVRALSWKEWIEDASGGRLQIDLAPVNTYGIATDLLNLVKTGVVDVAVNFYGGYATGIIPEANVEVGMPFAWSSVQESYDAYMYWGLFDKFQAIYAEQNIKWFPVTPDTYGTSYMTTFPALKADDVKGRKIRAAGIVGEWVKAMGGSPVNVSPAEWYMALKLGTIEGVISGANQLEDTKLKEVIKYVVIEPSPGPMLASVIMNMDKFKALPKDIQDQIQKYSVPISWGYDLGISPVVKYQVAKSSKDYGIQVINWSGADADKAIAAGISTWDTVSVKSPRTKELVDIVKTQARLLGKMK